MIEQLPESWKRIPLGAAVRSLRTGCSVNGGDSPAAPGEVGVLKVGAVTRGRFLPAENKVVLPHELARVQVPVRRGTILFNRKNTPDLVGSAVLVECDVPDLYLPDLIWEIECAEDFEAAWLVQYLQSKMFRDRMMSAATGSSQSMVNVTQPSLLSTEIIAPPHAERRRIAVVLKTWDDALDALDRLIAARADLSDEVSRRLWGRAYSQHGELAKAKEIFAPVSARGRTDLPLLAVMQDLGVVRRDDLERRVAMPEGDTSSYKAVEPGDFIISLRSFEGGLELAEIAGLVSPAYTVLRPTIPIEERYYKHFFKSGPFIARLDSMIFGIRDGKQISFRDMGDLRIPFPSIDEQRSVADALDALQEEVGLVRKEREALQRQKRGLMQKLLSGKWRVPETMMAEVA